MSASLELGVAALAGLSDSELHGLISMVDEGPQLAPSLFAWVEHVCDWEQHRRVGSAFRLCQPHEALEPGEMADAALVLALLRAVFGKDDPEGGSAVVGLLDRMIAELVSEAIPRRGLNA